MHSSLADMSTVNPRVVLFSVIFTKIIFDRIYNLAQVGVKAYGFTTVASSSLISLLERRRLSIPQRT
jgi:hypothetical protein